MCFSATASFSAGFGLLICGVFSLLRAKEKSMQMIAAIPLIFGIQQIVEGFVWLSFINPNLAIIRMPASYLFLSWAGIIWPLWIPLSIACFEGKSKFHYFIPSLIAGGICATGFIIYVLSYPLTVAATCNIIYYFDLNPLHAISWISQLNVVGSILYVVATILPFFISRSRLLWFLGFLITGSYIASYLFYMEAFVSVWCFFAALISIFVYGFVSSARNV